MKPNRTLQNAARIALTGALLLALPALTACESVVYRASYHSGHHHHDCRHRHGYCEHDPHYHLSAYYITHYSKHYTYYGDDYWCPTPPHKDHHHHGHNNHKPYGSQHAAIRPIYKPEPKPEPTPTRVIPITRGDDTRPATGVSPRPQSARPGSRPPTDSGSTPPRRTNVRPATPSRTQPAQSRPASRPQSQPAARPTPSRATPSRAAPSRTTPSRATPQPARRAQPAQRANRQPSKQPARKPMRKQP